MFAPTNTNSNTYLLPVFSNLLVNAILTLCVLLKSLMCEFPIDSDLKAMSYTKHVQNK